jgi:hypothetical protein
MLSSRYSAVQRAASIVFVLLAVFAVTVQGQKLALYMQAAAPVPASKLETLTNFAHQRCSAVTSAEVCSMGELMYAQRLTDTYIGNSVSVAGVRRLARALNSDHVVIFRIVRWENRILFKLERSLLFLGTASFMDEAPPMIISPLGILFGLEREATVALLMTVINPSGDVEFTTTVTYADRPLFSLFTADPLEAAKRAVEAALYQLAVVL